MTTTQLTRLNAALLVFLVSAFWMVDEGHGAYQLKWSPQASVNGLSAFEGVEDDPGGQDPGVKHIYVEGDHYRFDMKLQQRDKGHPDRQRNEVRGMKDPQGNVVSMLKGDRWRVQHSLYIASSLRATKSFTHIMQIIAVGDNGAGGPVFTISLRLTSGTPTIELRILLTSTLVASTPLEPLHNSWIHSSVDFTADDNGRVRWVLTNSSNDVVLDSKEHQGTLWKPSSERVRPKWGIYRSISDTANLRNCSMLIKDLKVYKFVNSASVL